MPPTPSVRTGSSGLTMQNLDQKYWHSSTVAVMREKGEEAHVAWLFIPECNKAAQLHCAVNGTEMEPLGVLGQNGRGQNGTDKMVPIESSINQAIRALRRRHCVGGG